LALNKSIETGIIDLTRGVVYSAREAQNGPVWK